MHHIDAFNHDRYLLWKKAISLVGETYTIFDDQNRPTLFVRRELRLAHQIKALLAGILAGGVVAGIFIGPAILMKSNLKPNQSSDLLVILLSLGSLGGAMTLIGVTAWRYPKRNFRCSTNESMDNEVMHILHDPASSAASATFTVADADLNLLGWFTKQPRSDFRRRRWFGYGPDGQPICLALEDSADRSILVGALFVANMINFLPNFIILTPDGRTKLGEFTCELTFADKYVLDLTADVQHVLDRRMALALGVLLDAVQRNT